MGCRTSPTYFNLEPIGSRVGKPARKPLRTLKEMAEEFGIHHKALCGKLKLPGAPLAKLNHRGASKANWYDPDEMRAWWKGLGTS